MGFDLDFRVCIRFCHHSLSKTPLRIRDLGGVGSKLCVGKEAVDGEREGESSKIPDTLEMPKYDWTCIGCVLMVTD